MPVQRISAIAVSPAFSLILAIVLANSVPTPGLAEAKGEIRFSRDILPILSDKCFVCHGPDTRDPDMLRLDTAADATADRDGVRAIDPERPDNSEALRRLQSKDDPMPPADAEKQLTVNERELLIRWIRQGGQYEQHWAFVRPSKSLPDALKVDAASARGMIDQLVRHRLSEAGQSRGKDLHPAPRAERSTLARRAALVLTGLPPEPEQLRKFLEDASDDAYATYVDTLLSSPRFGEHQARYWLDAVRYGDTHGLHLDNRRGIYPYRDWVIRAFNENLPLDDFITWQLAGDLLPNPSLEHWVATGFVRMNPTTSEGGAIPAEFQAKNNFDRVETLGTVLLGMTMTCARCHSHKYDPIPQTEYYRLMAFFNSTAENSMDGNKYEYGPVERVPENYHAWDRWRELVTAKEDLTDRETVRLMAQLPATQQYARQTTQWKSSHWEISKPLPVDEEPGDAAWSSAEGLPGTGKVKLPKQDGRSALWVRFDLETRVGQTLWLKFHGGPSSRVLVDGELLKEHREIRGNEMTTSLPLTAGAHEVVIQLRGAAEQPCKVELSNPWEPLAKGQAFGECDATSQLRMVADAHGKFASMNATAEALELASKMADAQSTFTTTLVARDLPQPRPTHVLRRGEYNLPIGDPLEPDVVSVMGALPDKAPRNRLGLAQWLTSRDHPLVSRVLVNRLWQRVFGAGLVRTPEDFGLQGQYPTHPRLLDWLAVELQDSGWDQKHMLREFVLSETFQQNSAWRDDLNDPENRWLARGPGYRLDAEVLRDLGLWASQLLDPHMGGEGVKPYQPGGLWQALAHPASNTKKYVRDSGQRLYRRSLYVYWKRTSPHPMMILFDAPDRESSCVRRSRTNTAPQSLGLLNETQRVEMARSFAERLLTSRSSDEERLDLMFTLLACRAPSDKERSVCTELLSRMKQRYDESPDDAKALISIGEASRDESLSAAEHAAWTVVASTVLASDVALLLY